MNQFLAMCKQQLIGSANIATFIVILFQVWPAFLMQWPGKLICALAAGALSAYLNYNALKNQAQSLRFSPSETQQKAFDDIICSCSFDPKNIHIRYAYFHQSPAAASGSVLIIDPLIWHGLEDDEAAKAASEVIRTGVVPHLSVDLKRLGTETREILTPAAQRFILKHELGHMYQNYSHKKIAVVGILGTIATYAGVSFAAFVYYNLAQHGLLAILGGIAVGSVTDILTTYLSNTSFKLREEMLADLFAASVSDATDIEAAACFFEQHQKIVDSMTEWPLGCLPSIIVSGHLHGAKRAAFLRSIIRDKKQSKH